MISCLTVPLWPNLEGSEDAPTTAKRGLEKKVLRAASMVGVGVRDVLKMCRLRSKSFVIVRRQ